jgi:alanine racemase
MITQHGRLEISRGRLRHNVELLQKKVGDRVTLCATVKADAYGHGVREVSGMLRELGMEWAAVYTLEEAAEVGGIPNVLVLAPLVVRAGVETGVTGQMATGLRVNVTDVGSARRLSAAVVAARAGVVDVHVQVDVGLTRAGARAAEAAALADAVAGLPGLRLEGVFGHFSHGDAAGHAATAAEVALFHQVADPIRAKHPGVMLHLQNSGGAWRASAAGLDMVRIGIALYGLQPSVAEPIEGLQPIARVVAPLLAIHEVPAGTGVGYGHTFRTERVSRIGVVPVGYADGYPRQMSGRAGVVQIGEHAAPVVGRVSMDQITVDVTGLPVEVGDDATVISWEPEAPNSVDGMAGQVGTIGYELATHFGPRLKRAVVA